MVSISYFAAASFAVCAQPAFSARLLPPSANFEEYHTFFGRSYARDSHEGSQRQALFEQRANSVRLQNEQPGTSWKAGLNAFSDWTHEELARMQGWRATSPHHGRAEVGFLATKHANRGASMRVEDLPESKDWSHLKSVTAADQGSCGSCWAVAASLMLRANHEIHTGEVKKYSAQEFVNCVQNPNKCGGSGGCDGATVELAIQYAEEVGIDRLQTESDLPYLARSGTCGPTVMGEDMRHDSNSDDTTRHGISLHGANTLQSNAALPLLEALLSGPVAVSAAAGNWFSYSSGIFDKCSDFVINHAILMIGFGQDDTLGGKKYWTILNSWGEHWGENGKMRVLRAAHPQDEPCGDDLKPSDGVACQPYPQKVTTCGCSGITYDSVAVNMSAI